MRERASSAEPRQSVHFGGFQLAETHHVRVRPSRISTPRSSTAFIVRGGQQPLFGHLPILPLITCTARADLSLQAERRGGCCDGSFYQSRGRDLQRSPARDELDTQVSGTVRGRLPHTELTP